jgi:hypothetical protein
MKKPRIYLDTSVKEGYKTVRILSPTMMLNEEE